MGSCRRAETEFETRAWNTRSDSGKQIGLGLARELATAEFAKPRGDERELVEPSNGTEAAAGVDLDSWIHEDQASAVLLYRLHAHRARQSSFGLYGMDQSHCCSGAVLWFTVRTVV